jgi:hypothetical protein
MKLCHLARARLFLPLEFVLGEYNQSLSMIYSSFPSIGADVYTPLLL